MVEARFSHRRDGAGAPIPPKAGTMPRTFRDMSPQRGAFVFEIEIRTLRRSSTALTILLCCREHQRDRMLLRRTGDWLSGVFTTGMPSAVA
jgi:hypothetical protein